ALVEILEIYEVGLVIESATATKNKNYALFKNIIKEKGVGLVQAVRGEKISVGHLVELEIMHPFFSQNLEYENLNNASVVVAVFFKNKKLLFMGDLEEQGEQALLNYLKQKNSLGRIEQLDLIKIGHHGSRTATGQKLLELTKPKAAIISCGSDNKFHHPHTQTLEKLQERKIEILRTDEIGDIELKY
ncbi:MAG: MBL fold metallo-hydrolase, partial [Candidatus Moranbacteria bacterium]|nr:MBL fold metallo-hydrolase [Candidatus Moranbacteria bacterium]